MNRVQKSQQIYHQLNQSVTDDEELLDIQRVMMNINSFLILIDLFVADTFLYSGWITLFVL